MRSTLFSKTLICSTLALISLTAYADAPVATTVTLYQSTTWTKQVTTAVVRQGSHADLFYCVQGSNFTGDPTNAAQILAFFKSTCTNELTAGFYSHANNTGFTTKVYVPTGASQPTRLIATSAYTHSLDSTAVSAGFLTYTIDLDVAANPAASTLLEQGVNTQYKNSDNPTMNDYKETFAFVGASPIDFDPITN